MRLSQDKKGFDFELSDGKIIKNQDLTYPAPAPKKYAYCSDTMYKPDITPLFKGQIYCITRLLLDELKPTAVRTGHSTAREAATIAKEAQVKKLMIGHFFQSLSGLQSFARRGARGVSRYDSSAGVEVD